MRSHKIFYGIIILLICISIVLAIWIDHRQQGKDTLNFTISTVSFIIALLALYIAVKTYTSIDSVNNISKMDGNILDNTNYVTSVPELILQFKAQDEKQLEEQIFNDIEYKLKNESKTAVQFADTLQHMIDLIVFLPAVFNAKNIDKSTYKNRMESILEKIDNKCNIFRSINKGNSIQINETIKLFKGVISYQKLVADNNFNVHADLLQVRGPILRNPVTKTIYNNYLGLYYNKKGMHLIRQELSMNNEDVLSLQGLTKVTKNILNIDPSIREDIVMYLEAACEHFDKALVACEEDIMWPGFINYNKARTLYFLSLLKNNNNLWFNVMKNAIQARSKLNRLIDEVLVSHNISDTHLKVFFIYQEELARLVNLNILYTLPKAERANSLFMYRGFDLGETKNENVKQLFNNIPSFSVIENYQDNLLQITGKLNEV